MASPEQTRGARRRPTPGLLALLAVALGLAFVAAGCGSDDGDEAAGTTTEQAATTGPGAFTTVPDIGETDLPDAAQQLADEGLRVAVEYVPSSEPRGRVIGQPQAPGAGSSRATPSR